MNQDPIWNNDPNDSDSLRIGTDYASIRSKRHELIERNIKAHVSKHLCEEKAQRAVSQMMLLKQPVSRPQDIFTEQSYTYVSPKEFRRDRRGSKAANYTPQGSLYKNGGGLGNFEDYAMHKEYLSRIIEEGKFSETQKIDRNLLDDGHVGGSVREAGPGNLLRDASP